MAYHSVTYLFVFLPIVLLLYQLVPKKGRWAVLLMSSYFLFWTFSKHLVLYLIGTTILTYSVGILLTRLRDRFREEKEKIDKKDKELRSKLKNKYKRREKLLLAAGIIVLLSVLAYLKYYNFFAENANVFLEAVGSSWLFEAKKLLLPIGISFYTLEAIGYMADVYWEKIPAERNLAKIALFLSFFPQIMEGPISMYTQTADALWAGNSLKADNLSKGAIRIIWGMFKKIVIADRLYVIVAEIFDYYEDYSGIIIVAGAIAYTIQLYMEFSGCIDIVIGSGKLFGVTLPENFKQPFVSKNASEFWRRWHISLGAWFKAYVFYPGSVSGLVKKWNKFAKKHFSKHIIKVGVSAIALYPVWLCNGLWHGANWTYIFYGMYYFVILLFGVAVEPVREAFLKKFKINENALYWRIPQILKTWVIIFTGELFFRANTLGGGFAMFKSIFKDFEFSQLFDGTLLHMGLDSADFAIIGLGCVVVAIVGSFKERNLLGDEGLHKLKTPLRWAIYYALIIAVIVFGAYGVGYQQVDLIYAGF